MNKRNPITAAALSLVPGVGHLYIGRTRKGVALLCIDTGLVVSLLLFHFRLAFLLVSVAYFMTMVPAGLETYLVTKTGRTGQMIDSKIYVVLMLWITGLTALPLLWQNARFSRRAKILLTVAVPLLAILFFGGLARWGTQFAKSMPRALSIRDQAVGK